MADLAGGLLDYGGIFSSYPNNKHSGAYENPGQINSSNADLKKAGVVANLGAGSGGPSQTKYYHMIGYNGSTNVGWTVTGSADFDGTYYTGSGTLVPSTIRVIAMWSI